MKLLTMIYQRRRLQPAQRILSTRAIDAMLGDQHARRFHYRFAYPVICPSGPASARQPAMGSANWLLDVDSPRHNF